jgi:hypothetical protein
MEPALFLSGSILSRCALFSTGSLSLAELSTGCIVSRDAEYRFTLERTFDVLIDLFNHAHTQATCRARDGTVIRSIAMKHEPGYQPNLLFLGSFAIFPETLRLYIHYGPLPSLHLHLNFPIS